MVRRCDWPIAAEVTTGARCVGISLVDALTHPHSPRYIWYLTQILLKDRTGYPTRASR